MKDSEDTPAADIPDGIAVPVDPDPDSRDEDPGNALPEAGYRFRHRFMPGDHEVTSVTSGHVYYGPAGEGPAYAVTPSEFGSVSAGPAGPKRRRRNTPRNNE